MRRAWLLVVVSWLAGGCTWLKDRGTIRSVITETAPRLDARRSVLGPVEIHGDEIDLLGGRLKLVVRVPHEHDDEGGDRTAVHVHVLAIPRDRKTGRLDLCIVGTQLAEAARALTDNALPPLVVGHSRAASPRCVASMERRVPWNPGTQRLPRRLLRARRRG